jgi:hypothetical protein
MTYEIHKKLNKTGRRVMFYPTIDGKRLTSTLFARKWEAINLAKAYIKYKNAA